MVLYGNLADENGGVVVEDLFIFVGELFTQFVMQVLYCIVILKLSSDQIVDQHMLADGVLWISAIKLEENINSCVVCFLLDPPILLVFCPFS